MLFRKIFINKALETSNWLQRTREMKQFSRDNINNRTARARARSICIDRGVYWLTKSVTHAHAFVCTRADGAINYLLIVTLTQMADSRPNLRRHRGARLISLPSMETHHRARKRRPFTSDHSVRSNKVNPRYYVPAFRVINAGTVYISKSRRALG